MAPASGAGAVIGIRIAAQSSLLRSIISIVGSLRRWRQRWKSAASFMAMLSQPSAKTMIARKVTTRPRIVQLSHRNRTAFSIVRVPFANLPWRWCRAVSVCQIKAQMCQSSVRRCASSMNRRRSGESVAEIRQEKGAPGATQFFEVKRAVVLRGRPKSNSRAANRHDTPSRFAVRDGARRSGRCVAPQAFSRSACQATWSAMKLEMK